MPDNVIPPPGGFDKDVPQASVDTANG